MLASQGGRASFAGESNFGNNININLKKKGIKFEKKKVTTLLTFF
jgi:hypothetical protein